ncbi:MAG TPA: glycosyltransferase [Saprospiraceae bacterium]|nr:glycosyltransferase [Saprospiraceae bacterium]
MRKIKVAFFSDILIEDFDGANRTMFQIIGRIPQEQFEFFFICGERPKKEFPFKIFEVPNLKVPFNEDYKMAMPALVYFSMRKAVNKFKPDVVHIASPSLLGNFAIEYAKRKKIPIITIYHTHFISYVEYYTHHIPVFTEMAKSTVISGQKTFYNKCDLTLVPTTQIRDELISYGFKAKKLVIWPRGLDRNIFTPEARDEGVMKKITGNDHPNIIFASRLVWEKNLETLINIYELSRNKGHYWNFIIAGDGVARAKMEGKMPEAYFLGNVHQKTLSTLFATSDIFVFPSVSETYGNVVIEAMACGCPCVIARGGGTFNLVKDNINGFMCEPYDAKDYVEKIQRLLSDDELKHQFIIKGLEFTNKLDWDTLVNKYLEWVKKLYYLNRKESV